MTSRPSLGIQRQPQRSLSGSGLISKPTPYRGLSQHQASPATLKQPDNYVDLTSDGSESAQNRIPPSKLGRSRLNIELLKGSKGAASTSIDTTESQASAASPVPRGKPIFYLPADEYGLDDLGNGSLPAAPTSARGFEKSSSQMPLPMPKRPSQMIRSPGRRRKVDSPNSIPRREARPKPYVLEVPSNAPHYPLNGHADFFPWTGDHPEDQFNDHAIRQGFFDKTQTTQNETGSAKISITPSLKHKSGLQTLSSLFTTILAQRRAHGQITSISSFKPPPRVTLTDTKREAWLRDLANPTISLRRLSRTIPHGIRGKVLLDQCLIKRISTDRAVWLAKCVGANEIRAFKRKGLTGTLNLGGEAKWIRDWTIFVEQFIESVVAASEEKEWKLKMSYAMRLAAHLYSEFLLDRDHYLDWLLASLEGCQPSKIPIWLLIAQIYWDDLLRCRKYGCRLGMALCGHLRSAQEIADRDIFQPLIEHIVKLLRQMMSKHPESLVSPKLWLKHRSILSSCLTPEFDVLQYKFNSISARNERLAPSLADKDVSPRRKIIQLLDETLQESFCSDLPRLCVNLMSEWRPLIQTVVEWSISSYRPGLTKVYVAARLLRAWSKFGPDLTEVILELLSTENLGSGANMLMLYHLVSELARSGHFSVSKYMKWLIARGGIHTPHDISIDGPCATRLLAELPIGDLPDSLLGLRRTMLSRASFSMDMEAANMKEQVKLIESALHKLSTSPLDKFAIQTFLEQGLSSHGSTISRTVKSGLGSWIRDYVRGRMSRDQKRSQDHLEVLSPGDSCEALTSQEFNIIRYVLESMQDYSMLADVLKMFSTSSDHQVLASVCDTLNLHCETFMAIGAAVDIFESLAVRFRSLISGHDLDDITFLTSLHELSTRLPEASASRIQLAQELARSSFKTATDACSPISDHMTEVLQVSESEFADEIERVFSSGTTMDPSTFEHIFEMIMNQMEISWLKSPQNVSSCSLLLKRLKAFDVKHFDSLLNSWLSLFLRNPTRCTMSYAVSPLIVADCLDFETFLACCETFWTASTNASDALQAAMIAAELLDMLLGTKSNPDYLTAEEAYRLRIKTHIAQKQLRGSILSVIRRDIECTGHSMKGEQHVLGGMGETTLYPVLQEYTLMDLDKTYQQLIEPLAKSSDPEVARRITQLVRNLLISREDPVEYNVPHRIESAFRLVDDITLPFCLMELRSIFATEDIGAFGEATENFEAVDRAIDGAVDSDNRAWTSLMPELDLQIPRRLCQRAERLFLESIPSPRSENSNMESGLKDTVQASRYLFVIDHTAYSMKEHRDSTLGLQIIEKINDLYQVDSQDGDAAEKGASRAWLPLLVDFISRHAYNLESSKSSYDVRARILLSLSRLYLQCHVIPSFDSSLLSRIFDVALLLVDDLPDEARSPCVRFLREKKITDAHLQYIFSYSNPPMESLQLKQKGKQIPYPLRRWEILSEPTPNVGENDTSLSLTLFQARRV